MPCEFKMKSWSFRISKSSPRILNSNGTFTTRRSRQEYYRGPLPADCHHGDFSAGLRALIVSLKYCGNMSVPKIGEFLENFDVQVSARSLSNILTKSAELFEQEYDDLLIAGLSSTAYQHR